MSTSIAPQRKIINATSIIDKLEFTEGISKKSGNPFFLGTLYVKSPISDTPIRLDLEYPDDNTAALVKLAIKNDQDEEVAAFGEGIKDDEGQK